MAQQRLTDRSLAPYVDKDSLIHIVNTGDTTQYSGGSSYKVTLETLQPIFSGGNNTYISGGTYNNSNGTLTLVNSTGGTISISGFTTGGTSSFGIFGISDSSGEYTYYSTLQSAINSSVFGDTIQMFANVVETSPTTVILKDGVDINMNGYTYTLNSASSDNCLTDNNSRVSSTIYDGTIIRSGSTYVNDTTSLCLYIQNSTSNIKTFGVTFKSPTTTAINNNGTLRGSYVEAYARGIVNTRKLYSVNVITQLETAIYCDSTNSEVYDSVGRSNGLGYGIGMLIPSFAGVIVNSVGYSLGQAGIYTVNTKEVQSCIGYSSANNGISSAASILNDCKGYSSAGSAVNLQNVILASNILGYSFASYGAFVGTPTNGVNSKIQNLTASSATSYGCGLNATGTATLTVKNLQSTSLLSGGSGYPCIVNGNNNIKIMGGSLDSWNSAQCIYSTLPITVSYVDLSFKTSTSPPVNINITQGATGPMDAYGNVII